MKFQIIFVILSQFYLHIHAESYKDAKVVDFQIKNEKQLDALKRLEFDDGVSDKLYGFETKINVILF
jgi:hypothetical protein